MPEQPEPNVLGEFLRARRDLLSPDRVGIRVTARRRSPGLTRYELAERAGISAEYYVRLEQGRDRNPSSQVVDALARALQLDAVAASFLHELARARPQRADAPAAEEVPPGVLALMATWSRTPSYVVGRFGAVLAASPAVPLLTPACTPGGNMFRAIFLDPDAARRYVSWEGFTAVIVGGLRSFTGPDVDDPRLRSLVDELSARSERFDALWRRHDVRPRAGGSTVLDHPEEGRLELDVETLGISGEGGLTLVVYSAPAGSRTAEVIARLVERAGSVPVLS